MDDTGQDCDALVIGGGPAGLAAADALAAAGRRVILADAKPSMGRKFLMAGKSGLNLTKMEPAEAFLSAYGPAAPALAPMIDAFGPVAVRDWAVRFGQTVFVGSTGRLFPTVMKASPLLRAWLSHLEAAGVDRRVGWRWTGWDRDRMLFKTPDGPQAVTPRVAVFALGGASWARLGSDGAWAAPFAEAGVALRPFAAANVGITVDWSPHMAAHFGAPLKAIALGAGQSRSRGEVVVSHSGIEGGGLYALTPALREGAPLTIDLAPDLSVEALTARLARAPRKLSMTNRLRRAARLSPAAIAVLRDCARPLPTAPDALARSIKTVAIPYRGLAPMDGAISTAGGVAWDALDTGLMLRDRPGTFCAGEMIDWEAPTGGYLITACLATGYWAGRHAAQWAP